MRPEWKITIFLVITFLIGFGSLILLINALFSPYYYFLIPFIIATAIITVVFLAHILFKIFKSKKLILTAKVIGVSYLVISVGSIGYILYQNSIPELADEEPYMGIYQPFDNEGTLAKLDKTASLKLTENLPRLDGATALYPLYAAFAEATYPDKRYNLHESEVSLTTTPHAYERLIDGEVDIIFVAGPSDRQLKEAEDKGVTLKLTPIGKEAFVFFVHQRNPVDGLSIEQIQKIYSGEIDNWSTVGGKKHSIRAFQRPDDSGSQTALERLMGTIPLTEPPTENVVGGMGGIISQTANYKNYRNAIGYSFRYFSMDLVANNNVKFLAVNDVYPSKETIRNDEYPISSYFYAVTVDEDNENVNAFIEWILSDEGQELVEKTGYVSLSD